VVHWFRDAVTDLFRRLEPVSGKRRFCEKTPSHALYMDLIHEVFPDAQFIHMIRNGESVVRSLQDISWAPSGLRGVSRNTATWITSVRTARTSGNKFGPAQYYELRYEDLVANPRPALERLCDFLEEPFDERMIEFHKAENSSWGIATWPFPDPGQEATRQRTLNFVERKIFRHLASNLMRDLGYYK